MYETLRSIMIDRMFKKNGVDKLKSRRHFQRVFCQAALVALANRAVAEHEQVIADDVLSYSNLQAYGLITLQALQDDLFRVVMSPIVLDAWIILQGTPYRKKMLMSYRNVNLGLGWLVVAAVLADCMRLHSECVCHACWQRVDAHPAGAAACQWCPCSWQPRAGGAARCCTLPHVQF